MAGLGTCTHLNRCQRQAAVQHACIVAGCGVVTRPCKLHMDAAMRRLQEHVRGAHPVEYALALAGAKPIDIEK